jgi:hypothetical protein
MAPESINRSTPVDARSDVYSVGGVAYALITGQPVFTGKSGVDIIGHHLHSIPLPPSKRLGVAVDPFLERLILQLPVQASGRPAGGCGRAAGADRRRLEGSDMDPGGGEGLVGDARARDAGGAPRGRNVGQPGPEPRGGRGQPGGQLGRNSGATATRMGLGARRDL